MGRVFAVIAILAVAWFGYTRYTESTARLRAVQGFLDKRDEQGTRRAPPRAVPSATAARVAPSAAPAPIRTAPAPARTQATPAFECDGRTRCTQMTSCADATYVLQHCPDTEMDGDNDGVPCESQWCG